MESCDGETGAVRRGRGFAFVSVFVCYSSGTLQHPDIFGPRALVEDRDAVFYLVSGLQDASSAIRPVDRCHRHPAFKSTEAIIRLSGGGRGSGGESVQYAASLACSNTTSTALGRLLCVATLNST